MSTSKRSETVVVALAFVVAPLLVLTLGAGLSWAVWSGVGHSERGPVPENSRLTALSGDRVLASWDTSAGDTAYALYDRGADRVLWRWTSVGTHSGFGRCEPSGAYVACDDWNHARRQRTVHLFDERGHLTSVEGTLEGGFAVDAQGRLAVLRVMRGGRHNAELVFHSMSEGRWTKTITSVSRSPARPVAISTHHIVADTTVLALDGEHRGTWERSQLVGISPQREERLLAFDGVFVAHALGSDVQREGPELRGEACLLGHTGRTWIVAEGSGRDDGPPALVAIDRESLALQWRTSIPDVEWLDCRLTVDDSWNQTPLDAELPGEIVVLTSREDLALSPRGSRSAQLSGISLAQGNVLWSASLPVSDESPFVARRGAAAYVVLGHGHTFPDQVRVLRFEGATLTGAVRVAGPVLATHFLEAGVWAHGEGGPTFLHAPTLRDDGVADLRTDIARDTGIPTATD